MSNANRCGSVILRAPCVTSDVSGMDIRVNYVQGGKVLDMRRLSA